MNRRKALLGATVLLIAAAGVFAFQMVDAEGEKEPANSSDPESIGNSNGDLISILIQDNEAELRGTVENASYSTSGPEAYSENGVEIAEIQYMRSEKNGASPMSIHSSVKRYDSSSEARKAFQNYTSKYQEEKIEQETTAIVSLRRNPDVKALSYLQTYEVYGVRERYLIVLSAQSLFEDQKATAETLFAHMYQDAE